MRKNIRRYDYVVILLKANNDERVIRRLSALQAWLQVSHYG